jgi:HlyD family secretion protein
MNPKLRTTLWILAGLAGAALIALGLRPAPVTVELARAAEAPLVVSFTEEGYTRVRERWQLSAPVAGTLARVALEVGDPVEAGAPLLTLHPAEGALLDQASRARIGAEARAAEAERRAARDRQNAARAALTLARSESARIERLHGDGLVSAAERDRARSLALQSAAEAAAAEAMVGAATARIEAAEALLARGAGKAGEPIVLVAPVGGVVLARPIESEAPVSAGQPLLEVGDPAQLELVIELLSTDAVQVQPGMALRVHRWGGSQALAATVRRVEPVGFTKISALGVEEQRVRVRADLTSPREQWQGLGDGYRIEAEFILADLPRVLLVPRGALVRQGSGWAVYVDVGGVAELRPVEIGRQSALSVEVLGGLVAGEAVVVHPDDRVVVGSRLRATGA